MENGKALVKVEPSETSLMKVSEALFKSTLFPNAKNAYGAFAIVEYGHELGIGPMSSLQTMAIISGKICMAGQMMLSIALKNGVSYRIVKDTDDECEVIFKRDSLEYTSSFSIKEAKQAGIWRAQSGWEKFPRDMLFWRTVTRGLRRVAPDVILGLYAIEEIKDAPTLDAAVETKESVVPPVTAEQVKDAFSEFALIDDITTKTGEKNGKPWQSWAITVNGVKYGTFSSTISTNAQQAKDMGLKVRVESKAAKDPKWPSEIVAIHVEEPPDEPGAEEDAQ